jgi:hypothetical protein
MRWLVGGLSGAFALGFATWFHAVLQFSWPWWQYVLAGVEGALWGAVTGVGAVWLLRRSDGREAAGDGRELHMPLALAVTLVASALVLVFADRYIGGAFVLDATRRPWWGWIALAGALMPLFVLYAVVMGQRRGP